MEYILDMGPWSAVFAVPVSLVDKHLKLCGGIELKFILWALRNPARPLSAPAAFGEAGIPEAAFADCAEYWIQAGLLRRSQIDEGCDALRPAAAATPAPVQQPAVSPVQNTAEEAPLAFPVQRKLVRPDSIYIARRLTESPALRHLFQETEGILGRTLSPALSAALMTALDDFLMPAEVLIMLVSYVASIGKTSTGYIEALIKNWAEGGVNSMAAAEDKIRALDVKNQAWRKFVKVTGIPYRDMTKKEEPFILRWITEMKFNEVMLRLCYERCVENTGKLGIQYMDKIFENWYKLGLKDPDAVERSEADRKAAAAVQAAPSYNLSQFDQLNVFDIKDGN